MEFAESRSSVSELDMRTCVVVMDSKIDMCKIYMYIWFDLCEMVKIVYLCECDGMVGQRVQKFGHVVLGTQGSEVKCRIYESTSSKLLSGPILVI